MTEEKIVVLHESLIKSWLKDIVSFSILAVILYANHIYFGDKTIIAFMLVALWLIALVGRSTSAKSFYNKKSAIDYIDKIYKEKNEKK